MSVAALPPNVERIRQLIGDWRRFASETRVWWHGHTRSWRNHIATGFDDEVSLVQPVLFPAFAKRFLDWEIGVNLSPEQSGHEGRPDFTPADPVTHPFVFETKGSRRGIELNDPTDLQQVHRYLLDGRPRITQVVLTNLVGLRVFDLDSTGELRELYEVRLRDLLLYADHHSVEATPSAANLVRFVDQFRRKELTPAEKIARIREAHPWEPMFSITSSDWITKRLDRVVASLQADVLLHLPGLSDPARLAAGEHDAITAELQLLGSRLGPDLDELPLLEFIGASEGTPAHTALEQYAMHVAYYMATRLLLVRTWEDLKLLESMLHDGGFNTQMQRFEDIVEVAEHSFRSAQEVYRSLFTHSNNYSWFTPSHDVYVDVIYELAFTYLGEIDSDVLGQVYERLLARIDRKLLGQYYTPRDIIALIWSLIDLEDIADKTEAEGRAPRVLDIATGSGGFLVEAVARLRRRMEAQIASGAALDRQGWMNELAQAINGVEIQFFSRYLAELNLLVQIGHVVAAEGDHLRIAPIGVIAADTLSLHQPTAQGSLEVVASDQPERAARLHDVVASEFTLDVACGNPPSAYPVRSVRVRRPGR